MSTDVLLFAGQGAQDVGMGVDVVDEYPAAAEAFKTAGDAIDIDLLAICRNGPAERLERTDICQPAILTVSIAILRALESDAGAQSPLAAAGLSLGEYSALVAAGALGFTDAVRLTHARGTYMQEACDANPGTMYSIIGLDDEQVEEACAEVRADGGGIWPANYNSPGQLVISGEDDAAARAADLCNEMGARRSIQLDVAGAFHTPLMQPAAEKLGPELEATEFTQPRHPVVSNVSAEPVDEPARIRELLMQQVTSPVRWCKSMQWCAENGAKEFLELGPGRVLRGLLRRIDRDLDCTTINDVESLRKVTNA